MLVWAGRSDTSTPTSWLLTLWVAVRPPVEPVAVRAWSAMAASVVPPAFCTRVIMPVGMVQLPAVPLVPVIITSSSPSALAVWAAAATELPVAVTPEETASTGLLECTLRYTASVTVLAILPWKETVTEVSPAATVCR